jgi:uncharacterized membrane protein YhhN
MRFLYPAAVKTRRPTDQKDGVEEDLDLDRSARFLSAELPLDAELLYIGGLGALLYLMGLALDWHLLRLVSKAWPVVAVARWVLSQGRERKRPELAVVARALMLGALGDLLLEIGPSFFIVGAGAFLVGHLFYIQALHRETIAMHWARALPGLALAAGVVALLVPEVGPRLAVALGVYALVLAVVLFRAAARVGSPKASPFWARMGLLGAAFFAASDAVLAIDRFHTEIAGARYVVIATYWAAQALLAVSLVRGATAWSPREALVEQPDAPAEGDPAPASVPAVTEEAGPSEATPPPSSDAPT